MIQCRPPIRRVSVEEEEEVGGGAHLPVGANAAEEERRRQQGNKAEVQVDCVCVVYRCVLEVVQVEHIRLTVAV